MKTAEEIKKWLDEKKEFTSGEFIRWFNSKEPEYIDIPEGIRIVQHPDKSIGILFNDGQQVLSYYAERSCWTVIPPLFNLMEDIRFALVECKYEDLVVGDIFIYCSKEGDIQNRKEDLAVYTLFLGNDNCVYVSDDEDIINFNFSGNDCSHFYKVVKK